MKTVFDTTEIAHIWANQTQEKARNAHDNFYFNGKTIFSYGTHFPIATIDGDKVLMTLERYSNTTAKHISMVRNAVSHKEIIYCYDVPVYLEYASNKHGNNLNYWKRKITSLFVELGNKKIRNAESRVNDIKYLISQIDKYVEHFKIKISDKELLSLLKLAKSPDFVEQARQAKEKKDKETELQLKKAAKAYEKYILLWRNFDSEGIKNLDQKTKDLCNYYNQNNDAYTRLRLNKDDNRIETSKGVKIPVEIAKKAFITLNGCFTKACKNLSIPVMNYTITESNKKSIIAGCHNIPNEDVKYIADLLNW